ncbi:hypothetical protein ABW21_db0206823 [Orbilia brochopaga]|nr:hypothetical protein ABW21_db0206823 [Drechslerella brochopaga]
MQLSTNLRTVPLRIGSTVIPQYYSLYQGENNPPPLTTSTCVNIDYGQLPDSTVLIRFDLARDPPDWNLALSREDNLRDAVHGLAFYDGANCDGATIRTLYRLTENYDDIEYPSLFLANGPIMPPSRFGSWRPVFLSGQADYSTALAKLDVGQYYEFPQAELYQQQLQLLSTQGPSQVNANQNIATEVTGQQESGGDMTSPYNNENRMVIEEQAGDEVVLPNSPL